MKRRLLSFFLTLSILLSALPDIALTVPADSPPWKGSGTEKDPYRISKKDLWALSNVSNSGENLTGVYFLQTDDIDLGGVVYRDDQGKVTEAENLWTPVSTTTEDGVVHQFTGVYDGGGFKILNMVVDKSNDDAGFFGYIGAGGVIKYVNAEDGYVGGSYWAAA